MHNLKSHPALSEREQEVCEFLISGKKPSNNQIGRYLDISGSTVDCHLSNIYAKLQARSRTHAAVIYQRWKFDNQ